MAGIKSFEEIRAWQKAREMTREVFRLCATGPLSRQRFLADQMRQASVSVMANIAEGFECGGDGEFRQFLSVAKASAAELKSHLYVAVDAGMITMEECKHVQSMAHETGLMIRSFMQYLRMAERKGVSVRRTPRLTE